MQVLKQKVINIECNLDREMCFGVVMFIIIGDIIFVVLLILHVKELAI
jgi:hypothetical protein